MAIGEAIRRLREQQRVSLRQLAAGTGLTASFLSRLERDKTSITVADLRKVAMYFNVPITRFLDDESQGNSSAAVFRKSERGRGAGSSASRIESLVPASARQLEAWLITAQPGVDGGSSHPHAGEELTYVLRGQVKYVVAGHTYLLDSDDAIFHPGDVAHAWEVVGTGECVLLCIGSFVER